MKKLWIAGLCLAMVLSLTPLAVAAEEDVAVTREYTETLHAQEPTDDKPIYATGEFVTSGDGFTMVEISTGTGDFNYTYSGSVSQIMGSTGKVEMITGGNGYIIYTTGPNGEVESKYVEGSLSGSFVGPDGSYEIKVENADSFSNADKGGDNAGVEEMVSAFCSLSFAGHSGVIMAAVLAGGCLVLLKRKDRR